jgi:hypothetical protein
VRMYQRCANARMPGQKLSFSERLGSSDALTGSVALRHCPTSLDFIF